MEAEPASGTYRFIKELDDGQSQKQEDCRQGMAIQNLWRAKLQTQWRVHKFSENVGVTSELSAPGGWYGASSRLRVHTN